MSAHGLTRRRAIAILAGSAGALAFGSFRPGVPVHEWRGTALGADARVAIAGGSPERATCVVARVLDEVRRLEDAFSLYHPGSELVRLNREGAIEAPSHDFRLLVERALGYWERTGGAFNPAVQPLWRFLAAHFATAPKREPDPDAIRSQLALCDPSRIGVGARQIRLAPGMALTFNGIAQGYITDRVAEVLQSEGARDIFLQLGESRALPGRAWRVGIEGADSGVLLTGRAIATSAGSGTPFTRDRRWHHLIDPDTGRAGRRFASVTVIAGNACEADALSTAIAASARLEPGPIAVAHPQTRVIAVSEDGSVLDTSPSPGLSTPA
jgi:thiamine biosynthesis lipoprotein